MMAGSVRFDERDFLTPRNGKNAQLVVIACMRGYRAPYDRLIFLSRKGLDFFGYSLYGHMKRV